MGRRKKNILTTCLVFIFFCFGLSAKETSAPGHEKSAAPDWRAALSHISSKRDFVVLQKWLPFAQVGDAKAFWEGFLALEKQDFDDANRHFQEVRTDSRFYEYASFLRAQLLLDQNKNKDALSAISPVFRNAKSCVKKIHWDIFWLKLEILAHLKQGAMIRNELKLLSAAELKDRFQMIRREFVLGYADLIAGDKNQAISHFTNVLTKNPGSDYDERIFAIARDFKISEDRLLSKPLLLLRAENLIHQGLADWGYEIYEKLSANDEDYTNEKALALFRARRYIEAAGFFEKLLTLNDASMSRLQILVRLSQCYTRTDNFEKAMAIQQKIAREFPSSENAKNLQLQLSLLSFDAKQFEKAADGFSELLTNNAKTWSPKELKQVRWYRFWSYYLLKDWQNAFIVGEQVLSTDKSDVETRKALLYFLGRICEKKNDAAAARDYYKRLLSFDENDYYRLLAKQRLLHQGLYASRLVHPDILKNLPQIAQNDLLNPVDSSLLKKHTGLVLSFVFSQLGLDDYAYDELKAFEELSKTQSDVALALPIFGNSRIAYSVGYAAQAGRLSGCDVSCAYFLRFPKAYAQYVEPFSALWKISPDLVYGIMRQESAFEPDVVSGAFAYGLMQIIPPTGREIADKIQDKNFHPHVLQNAKTNVLFGSYYLKQLSQTFNGELPPTIAAYNAGPYNVSRWLARDMHEDWDEFVELIPYSETKNYVKKVLVNYWIYDGLY